jgi:hypothetical protein
MRVELLVLVAITACADPGVDVDDGEAEGATVAPSGDAAASFAGLYAGTAGTHATGDVIALDLRVAPALDYVRARCYGTECSRIVPETDHYDVYTSSAGKTYVRFWSVEISHDHGDVDATPELVDVYEIKTSDGVQLRKSYTTRWVTLGAASEDALCTGGGGSWSDGACSCAAGKTFVAGAGGCVAIGGASEANCDASGGLWTDDDATLLGEYCICGTGRYDDASGSCAEIDP